MVHACERVGLQTCAHTYEAQNKTLGFLLMLSMLLC